MVLNKKIATSSIFLCFLILGAMLTIVGASMDSIVKSFNVSTSVIFMATSYYNVGRMFSLLISGILIKKFGAKKIFLAGLASLCTFLILIPLSTNFQIALLFFILGGFGHGLSETSAVTVMFESYPKNMDSKLSVAQGFFGLGNWLSPLLILQFKLDFKYAFILFSIISIISMVLVINIKYSNLEKTNKTKNVKPKNILTNNVFVSSVFVIFISVLSSVVNCFIIVFFVIFAPLVFGISKEETGIIYNLFAIAGMVGSVFFSFILKKTTSRNIMLLNSIISFILIILSFQGLGVNFLKIIFFFIGFVLAIMFSLVLGMTSELHPNGSSIANSITLFSSAATYFLVPLLVGKFVDPNNMGIILTITAIFNFILIIVSFTYNIYSKKI